MTQQERRYTSVPVEVRAGSEKMMIGGYAAKFERMSQNLGGFVERIAPGAFNKSRGDGFHGAVARHNHDDNMVLGTIAGGTLRLSVDNVGLMYEADLPQTRADVYELVQRGDVRQSSFAFATTGEGSDEWATSDQGYPMRTLLDVRLYDVASVLSPAYEDTSTGVRSSVEGALESLARHFDADIAEVRSMATAGDLTKFFKRTADVVDKKRSAQAALAAVLNVPPVKL
jgi:HK97 family phage prohead protease